MRKAWKSSLFLGGTALLGAMALSGTTALAGTVTMNITATLVNPITETVTTNMDFGSIQLDPAGDTIRINAAGAANGGGAAATPASVSTVSQVTGGGSGLITIASAIAFAVDVVYPADSVVVITDGTTSTFLNAIDTYSGGGTTNGTVTHAANTDTLIHVGGEIAFPAGATDGAYTGTASITINYS